MSWAISFVSGIASGFVGSIGANSSTTASTDSTRNSSDSKTDEVAKPVIAKMIKFWICSSCSNSYSFEPTVCRRCGGKDFIVRYRQEGIFPG